MCWSAKQKHMNCWHAYGGPLNISASSGIPGDSLTSQEGHLTSLTGYHLDISERSDNLTSLDGHQISLEGYLTFVGGCDLISFAGL